MSKRSKRRAKSSQNTNVTHEFVELAAYFRERAVQLLLLVGALLAVRLPNLTSAGLHYDEATYLYWGHVIRNDWSQRYIGAGWGGKQPLHAWLVALAEGIFDDPVFAGRFVSVLAGVLGIVLLWIIVDQLQSRRAAWIAALLYLVWPFLAIYERVALIDSLLSAEMLGVLLGAIFIVRRYHISGTILIAISLSFAALSKSVGWAFILLLPSTFLLLPGDWRQLLSAKRRGELVRPLTYMAVGVFFGWFIFYAAFGSSSAADQITQFEQQYGNYTLGISDLLRFPIDTWWQNLSAVFSTLFNLSTPILAVIGLIALIAVVRLERGAWVLALWVILPVVGQVIIANRFYARYILFSLPPLIGIIAMASDTLLNRLEKRYSLSQRTVTLVAGAAIALALAWPAYETSRLVFDPFNTDELASQYDALYSAADYIQEQAADSPVTVVVNYTPAPVEDGLAVLLKDSENVRVLRVVPQNGKLVLFDPISQQAYTAATLANQPIFYAISEGGAGSSILASKLDFVQAFESAASGKTIELHRVAVDADFN